MENFDVESFKNYDFEQLQALVNFIYEGDGGDLKEHFSLCYSLKERVGQISDRLEQFVNAQYGGRSTEELKPAKGRCQGRRSRHSGSRKHLEKLRKSRIPRLKALDALDNHVKPEIDKLRFVRELLCGGGTKAIIQPLVGEDSEAILSGFHDILVDLNMGYDKAYAEISSIGEV